jgi:putative transcriptional regulator
MAYGTMSAHEIKTVRESLGMTQTEFADALGVQQTAVSHWENGARRPSGSAEILIEMLRKQARPKKSKIFSR